MKGAQSQFNLNVKMFIVTIRQLVAIKHQYLYFSFLFLLHFLPLSDTK